MNPLPKVDIITPAYLPDPEYFIDSYNDICAQDIDWRWLVQIDGTDYVDIPTEVSTNPRVEIKYNDKQLGAATTRNRALARSTNDLIYAHDYDDRLEKNGLRLLADELVDDKTLGWASGDYPRLIKENNTWIKLRLDYEVPYGKIDAGVLWEIKQKIFNEEDRFTINPAPSSIMWRRKYVLALGGWGALSSCEDSFISNAIQLITDGVIINEDIGYYRKHDTQSSNDPYLQENLENNVLFFRDRVEALKELVDELKNK